MPNIAQYCPVLFNIATVTISVHTYRTYEIVRSIQILSNQTYPNIVRDLPILSSIGQYSPVAPCLDILLLKQTRSHFKSDLDLIKIGYMQV